MIKGYDQFPIEGESFAASLHDPDAKGKQIPGFLALLAAYFSDERTEVVKELDLLTTKVHHVKTIIATQQSYAGVSGVIETVDVGATLDDDVRTKLDQLTYEFRFGDNAR